MKSFSHSAILFCALVALILAACAPRQSAPFQKLGAEQVLDAFRAAGLDVAPARLGKDADDGLALVMVVQTLRFRVAMDGGDGIGYILSFAQREDMDSSLNFFIGVTNTMQESDAWTFLKDNVVVQLEGSVPRSLAEKFQAALQNLK